MLSRFCVFNCFGVRRYARGGDVVLIAGKGHEGYQEFSDGRIPFDDRKETRTAMDARRKARGEERV